MNKNLMKEFSKLVIELFKEPLANHGFKRELKKTEELFCTVVYGNKERYVEISANIYPRDYPPYFNLVLGEGSRDFLESDWNSIALWRLKNRIQKNHKNKEYSLKNPDKVRDLLILARDDLLEYGISFLSGDISLFREVRADQNRNREPYKIYSPDENGRYTSVDDPESVKMKKKYS